MIPAPEPTPGLYRDSTGTHYQATKKAKTGWHLEKLPAREPSAAFPREDFPEAVKRGIFTYQPETA